LSFQHGRFIAAPHGFCLRWLAGIGGVTAGNAGRRQKIQQMVKPEDFLGMCRKALDELSGN
tara:strand:+ start:621 stop:803 length:183 start_codon:yes stop_codon:yes gene_type:complete